MKRKRRCKVKANLKKMSGLIIPHFYQNLNLLSHNKKAVDLIYAKFLIVNGTTSKEILCLKELGALVVYFDKYFCSKTSVNLIVKLIELIVRHGYPPTLEILEERDFDVHDFSIVAESAVTCFAYLQLLLTNCKVLKMETEIKYSFLCNSIILYMLHCKKYMWSNEGSMTTSEGFLKKLKLTTGYVDLPSIMCDENYNPSIFFGVLQNLKPLLNKKLWYRKPCSGSLLFSLVFSVKPSYLAEYFADLLPPMLILINQNVVNNKMWGIICLYQITSNMDPSLLKIHDETDVIYNAIHPYIYWREVDVIFIVYPCLLKLICAKKTEIGTSSSIMSQWDRYDDIYHHMLLNAEMEESIEHLKPYVYNILLYIKEESAMKHLKHTIQVVRKFLAIFDGREKHYRQDSLQILLALMRKCWTRKKAHFEELLTIAMLLLYNIQENRGTLHDDLQDFAVKISNECLKKLRRICPVKFQMVAEDFIKDCCSKFTEVEILQILND